MNVEIFITTKFNGRVTNGSGAYGIVRRLEGRPDTAKCHVTERHDLSYQALSTYAAVEAIQCMVAPAHIKMYVDNAYAAHMIQKGSAVENANRDLWNQFYQMAEKMKSLEVERTKKHEYTERILKMVNAGGGIIHQKEKQEV